MQNNATDLNTSIPVVSEKRFHYDTTLFLTARVLQSFPVFKTLLGDEAANALINSILDGIDFSKVQSDSSLEQRDQYLTDLHILLVEKIKKALGKGMTMSDFFSFGQMDLLYRHQNKIVDAGKTGTNIPAVDTQLNHIERLLRQPIDEESGKAALAEEIFDPLMPHYVKGVYHLVVDPSSSQIIEVQEEITVEKFYSDSHSTLTNMQIQEYVDLVNAGRTKPFWFLDLSPLEQRYILNDLAYMKTLGGDFNKHIFQKYGNTSAKGRKFPGLSGLRRKEVKLFKKDEGAFTLADEKILAPNHFTSAGSPVHLQSDITDEQVLFAARNIARMLPVIKERREQWLQENVSGHHLSQHAVNYLLITSLVSPLSSQGKLADFISGIVGSGALRENNEEMMVRALKRAVDYINQLSETRELGVLNGELGSEDHFICDLAIFGINKFGKWSNMLSLESRKSLYQTGPMTAFYALAHDVQLFIDYVNIADKCLKGNLATIYAALTALDFSNGLAYLDRTAIKDLSYSQSNLKNSDDPRMKKLARRIEAALIFLNVAQKPNMKIVAAAMFEKINPGSTYSACKSSHDRKEHADIVSEAIDIAEQFLGRYPDPDTENDMRVLSEIVFYKKFIMQHPIHSRALSANNIGLKSHDSVGFFISRLPKDGNPEFLRAKEYSAKLGAAAVLGDFPKRTHKELEEVLARLQNRNQDSISIEASVAANPVLSEQNSDDEPAEITEEWFGSCWSSSKPDLFPSVNPVEFEREGYGPKKQESLRYPSGARTDYQKLRQSLYALNQYENAVHFPLWSKWEVFGFLVWTSAVFGLYYDRFDRDDFMLPIGIDAAIMSISYWVIVSHRSMINRLFNFSRYLEAAACLNQHIEPVVVETTHDLMTKPLPVSIETLWAVVLQNILMRELLIPDREAGELFSKYFNGRLNKEEDRWLRAGNWAGLAVRLLSSFLLEVLVVYSSFAFVLAMSRHLDQDHEVGIAVCVGLLVLLASRSQFNYFREMNDKCEKQVTIGGVGPRVRVLAETENIRIFRHGQDELGPFSPTYSV